MSKANQLIEAALQDNGRLPADLFREYVYGKRLDNQGRVQEAKGPRLSLKKEDGEYVVVWYDAKGKRDEGKTYYASDKSDAQGTMEAMQKEMDRLKSESIEEKESVPPPSVMKKIAAKGDTLPDPEEEPEDKAKKKGKKAPFGGKAAPPFGKKESVDDLMARVEAFLDEDTGGDVQIADNPGAQEYELRCELRPNEMAMMIESPEDEVAIQELIDALNAAAIPHEIEDVEESDEVVIGWDDEYKEAVNNILNGLGIETQEDTPEGEFDYYPESVEDMISKVVEGADPSSLV